MQTVNDIKGPGWEKPFIFQEASLPSGELNWRKLEKPTLPILQFFTQLSPAPELDLTQLRLGLELCFKGKLRPDIVCHAADYGALFQADMGIELACRLKERDFSKDDYGYVGIFILKQKSSATVRIHLATPFGGRNYEQRNFANVLEAAGLITAELWRQRFLKEPHLAELVIEPYNQRGKLVKGRIGAMEIAVINRWLRGKTVHPFSAYSVWSTEKACFKKALRLWLGACDTGS